MRHMKPAWLQRDCRFTIWFVFQYYGDFGIRQLASFTISCVLAEVPDNSFSVRWIVHSLLVETWIRFAAKVEMMRVVNLRKLLSPHVCSRQVSAKYMRTIIARATMQSNGIEKHYSCTSSFQNVVDDIQKIFNYHVMTLRSWFFLLRSLRSAILDSHK